MSARGGWHRFAVDLLRAAVVALAVATTAVLLSPPAHAAVRELWSFGWSPHAEADQVVYFELDICVAGACSTHRVAGGHSTALNDVWVDPGLSGDGTAVLRACRAATDCSGDSNRVVLDRTTLGAPPNLRFAP